MNLSPKARSFPPNITLWHILFFLIIAAVVVLQVLYLFFNIPLLTLFTGWSPMLYPTVYILFFLSFLFKSFSESGFTAMVLIVYFLLFSLPVIPVISSMYFKKWGRNLAFIVLVIDLILNLFNPSWAIGVDFVLIILLGIIFKKADEDAPIPSA